MSDEAGDPGERLVNGVFQGGGAKSVAYAGALRAIEDRGLWFGSVSGASAGAIVASLIASGMSLDEMESKVSEVLAAAKSPIASRFAKLAVGHAHSIFEGRRLRSVLDDAYRTAIGHTDVSPVSFTDLFEATGIELYVLTLDLADGLPVVFSRRTTPHADVAGAVTASSAIPAAFPAGRAVFDSVGSGAVVHQLVDGGAYANYPSFVFDDRGFRCWLRDEAASLGHWTSQDDDMWNAEERRPVIGFVLSDPEPLQYRTPAGFVPSDGPDISRRFDLGPTYTSDKRNTYLFGALLSSDWVRLLVGVALVVWTATSIATLPVGFRRYSTWLAGWLPDWLFPPVLVFTMAIVVLAAVASIVVIGVLMLTSRLLADTLVPSAKAVLGVPLETPPWLGRGDDAIVLRVPHGELSTVDFAVDTDTRDHAIETALISVNEQLDDPQTTACLEALLGGHRHERDRIPRGERTLQPSTPDDRLSARSIASLVVATTLIGVLAWWATNAAGSQSIIAIVLAIALAVGIGSAALVRVGGEAGRRAATRAGLGVTTTSGRSPNIGIAWMLAGAAMVVAGCGLSGWTMAERSGETSHAEVVNARTSPGDPDVNLYELLVEGTPATLTVESERHLRLGERAFIATDSTTGRTTIVGALDDAWFAVAIVLCALGLGVITAGVRSYRYTIRCRRLETLVSRWRSSEPDLVRTTTGQNEEHPHDR